MRYLLLTLLLAACGPIPVSMESTKQTSKQTSRQEVSQEVAQDVANDLGQASRQGTVSMPVIILCVQNQSNSANCAYPQKDGMMDDVKKRYKDATK